MIRIKNGVVFHPETFANPNVARIVSVTAQEAPEGYDVTITSGCDGEHCENSSHYVGKAIDLRTLGLSYGVLKTWVSRIQAVLGSSYFVLIEKDHIHIQFNG